MLKTIPAIVCAVLMSPAATRAELIPASRLVDWTPGVSVGVPGGIPTNRSHLINVTQAPYNADTTGTNDASGAINAAIAAAAGDDVVYLPAGTYRCNGTIFIGGWPYKSWITLRGDGDSTVLKFYGAGQTNIGVGGGSDYGWAWPTSNNTITAGLAKGSTQITIADTSAFSVGQLIQVATANDLTLPVVSVNGFDLERNQPNRRQMTRVTAKTATTLSIFPSLYGDYSTTAAKVHVAQMQSNAIGIENLLIDCTNSSATFTIWFEQCYGCWIKDVHIKNSYNYHIFLNDSLNCEVRRCYLDHLNHSGSNGAGLLCNTISGCLIEDNIIYDAQPLIEVNFGSCGNVFAYNYCDVTRGTGIDTNHGPHNAYNLYEGNVVQSMQSDGYFGSASHDTIFRNWITSVYSPTNSATYSVSLNRFTRNYSLVGNLIQSPGLTFYSDGVSCGNPNMGNSSYTGTAKLSAGQPWTDWARATTPSTLSQSGTTVTTPSDYFVPSDYTGTGQVPAQIWIGQFGSRTILSYVDARTVTVNTAATVTNGSFTIWPGPTGFQQLDLDVAGTLVRKENYYASTNGVPSGESAGSDTVPASLYRGSKPAWFGDLTWPAFDSHAPNMKVEAIPAGYRFVHGTDPSGVATNTYQKPTNVRIVRQ